jgi:hypothetical protein
MSATDSQTHPNPDGDCLAAAIHDAYSLLGRSVEALPRSGIHSTRDALRTLAKCRAPMLVARDGAGYAEKLMLKGVAWRAGVQLLPFENIADGDVILCLRSMRQLYGLPYRNGHWVVLAIAGVAANVHDRLWPMVQDAHANLSRADGWTIMTQIGATLRV